jgi:Protein of unknown function, DUF600
MKKDAALVELCRSLMADPGVTAGRWSKIVLIGVVSESDEGMGGYRFDTTGKANAVAPRSVEALDLLHALRDAMQAEDTARTPWVTCLLKIDAGGKITADFEYDDCSRWQVTPTNREQRLREFAAA